VKLLLDENISRRIVAALQSDFPGSSHVVTQGLSAASDSQVWQHAKANGFIVVSKDDDFTALSSLHGHPPRLIKLSLGNCTNDHVLDALVRQQPTIAAAFVDPAIAMVELVPSGE
jgi:predicted nuclease of predicted toxin-antitoxin system